MVEIRLVYIDDSDEEHTIVATQAPLLLVRLKRIGVEQAAMEKARYLNDPILNLKASAELDTLENVLNKLIPCPN